MIFLDSEYNRPQDKNINPLCLSFADITGEITRSLWVQSTKGKNLCVEYLKTLEGQTLVAFNVESEARALISIGVDPLKYEWVDLFLEYRMLSNHNHDLMYGEHLVDGKVKTLRPYRDSKGKDNLASVLFKMCGITIDEAFKEESRRLILDHMEWNRLQKDQIMRYCDEDTRHLPKLFKAMSAYYKKVIPAREIPLVKTEARWRGEYAVRTALMVTHGYPINMDMVKAFTSNIPILMNDCIQDIIEQFPEIKPFEFVPRTGKYKMNLSNIRAWIKTTPHHKSWILTDGGVKGDRQFSLSLEAFSDFFDFTHSYPRGNFGAQMVRFLKLKQSLNGFVNKAGAENKTFWDYVGSDGMVRPYMNIYKAQSSRSQPLATGFIFLKPAWQRSLVQAPEGQYVLGADYGSEEFFISALWSNDINMLRAYEEGDVYLYYGKLMGVIPPDGTKLTHPTERQACKATVLGISYMMSKFGLAKKLTTDTGIEHDEDMAQEYINGFEEAFPDFAERRTDAIEEYISRGYLKIPDGWYMFGHNENDRSVGNCPIQGLAAAIMRKAVQLAQDAGLNIIFTLHDALYIQGNIEDMSMDADTLVNCMREAFCFYFEGKVKEKAKAIRLDCHGWSADFEDEESSIVSPEGNKISIGKYHVDERAIEEYEKFKRYFYSNSGLELL